jgi:hypothetical protein
MVTEMAKDMIPKVSQMKSTVTYCNSPVEENTAVMQGHMGVYLGTQ